MKESLHLILDIQELDMKMLRLMQLRKQRQKELEQIDSLRKELYQQLDEKEKEIKDLAKTIDIFELKINDANAKIKKLEGQQSSIKKAEEFNAITQEMTSAERERIAMEQKVSDLVDKRIAEEELLEKIKQSLKTSEESTKTLENEIRNSIEMINEEGRSLKGERDSMATKANPELLHIYERLLRNKKDRVVVSIENRSCSGCHIALTAQHENLVRKGENLVFCEHCSRIHFWQEAEPQEGAAAAPKRRRRRMAST